MSFAADPTPDRPAFFGYKNTWWAFKSDDPGAVASAIGLKDAKPCNWEAGVSAACDTGVFVCPPLCGWVIVVGRKLPPGTLEDIKGILSYLLELSAQFGDVQAYATCNFPDSFLIA